MRSWRKPRFFMRPEELYLADILEAADAISRCVAGLTQETFLADERSRGAAVYQFIIIGEAASQLSESLQLRHPEVPWSELVGFSKHCSARLSSRGLGSC